MLPLVLWRKHRIRCQTVMAGRVPTVVRFRKTDRGAATKPVLLVVVTGLLPSNPRRPSTPTRARRWPEQVHGCAKTLSPCPDGCARPSARRGMLQNEQPSADVRGIRLSRKATSGPVRLDPCGEPIPPMSPGPKPLFCPNFVAYVVGDARASRTIVPSMARGSPFRGNLL